MNTNQHHENAAKMVAWVTWCAMTVAAFAYPKLLDGRFYTDLSFGEVVFNDMMMLVVANFSAAVFVRFILLPRQKSVPNALTKVIIGLALAESLSFFSIFLFHEALMPTKTFVWSLSLLGTIIYCPLFIRQFGSSGLQHPPQTL